MFCTSCGQQIPDGSKFCTKCGQPVVTAEAPTGAAPETGAPQMTPPTPGAIPAAAAAAPKAPKAPKKVNNKTVGIIAVAVILAVIAVGVGVYFKFIHKPTINLNKYASIEFDGYNTIGTAKLVFDGDKFEEDWGDKIEFTGEGIKNFYENAQSDELSRLFDWGDMDDDDYEQIADYLNDTDLSDFPSSYAGTDPAYFSQSSGLSNGDTVTYSWQGDVSDKEFERQIADLEAFFGYKIKCSDITAKVEGLEDIETFDAFDGVEITCSGIAPNGKVNEVSKGSDKACEYLHYSVEPQSGLSNGDTVTVTISYSRSYEEDWTEDFVDEYGKVPAETTKEFTVEGLQSYVSSTAEIPEETLELMKSQAEDTFNAEVANYYKSDTEKLTNCEYIGNYFLYAKEGASVNATNYIFLVYKASAHLEYTNSNGDSYIGNQEYYWYCRFDSLLLTEEGDCKVDLSHYETPRTEYESFTVDSGVDSGWWSTYEWDFYGYDHLSYMYNQLITTNIDRFTSEDNVEDITLTGDGTDVQSDDDPVNEDADVNGSGDGEVDGDAASDGNDGQVLSYSSDRALTEDDLKGLTKDEIQTAINEIYARHGYTFKDETILAQFKEYDWYNPTVASGDFSESVFSQTEKDNIALMREHL